MKVTIESIIGQKITAKHRKIIRDKLKTAFREWKENGQENLNGNYTLSVCEHIESGEDNEYISIPIEMDGKDGGYLHVYGIRESESIKN